MKKLFVALVCCVLSQCDFAEYWSFGPYVVYEIDGTDREMGRRVDGSGIIRRVPPNVMEVGANASFVIARVSASDSNADRYYIVDIKADHPYFNEGDITEGPYTAFQFEKEKARRNLPDFQREFSGGFWEGVAGRLRGLF